MIGWWAKSDTHSRFRGTVTGTQRKHRPLLEDWNRHSKETWEPERKHGHKGDAQVVSALKTQRVSTMLPLKSAQVNMGRISVQVSHVTADVRRWETKHEMKNGMRSWRVACYEVQSSNYLWVECFIAKGTDLQQPRSDYLFHSTGILATCLLEWESNVQTAGISWSAAYL